jgi:membrane protein implicated in regulation of membrane protease activity
MRRTVFEIAVAIAAATIVLLVAAVSGSLHGLLRWMLVVAVALVSCAVAWLAARRVSPTQASGIEVGNRIQAKENVDVRDVSINSTAEDVKVGNDIRAGRGVRISGIRLGKARGSSK